MNNSDLYLSVAEKLAQDARLADQADRAQAKAMRDEAERMKKVEADRPGRHVAP